MCPYPNVIERLSHHFIIVCLTLCILVSLIRYGIGSPLGQYQRVLALVSPVTAWCHTLSGYGHNLVVVAVILYNTEAPYYDELQHECIAVISNCSVNEMVSEWELHKAGK